MGLIRWHKAVGFRLGLRGGGPGFPARRPLSFASGELPSPGEGDVPRFAVLWV